MRKTIIATLLITSMGAVSTSTYAETAQEKQERNEAVGIGLGTGAVIGGLVAGPVGAIVAGVFGAAVTNDHYQDEEIKEQEQELAMKNRQLSEQEQELLAMRDSISDLKQETRTTHVVVEENKELPIMTVESNVQFTTGSYTIAKDYQEQLDLIATALKRYPGLQAKLTGHADQRGNEKYNQALSMQRAISVKQYLVNHGVSENQLITVALGEKNSNNENIETAFFDRKVVVEVSENPEAYAANR